MLDFPKGSRFLCPACGQADCTAYDTEQKTWRHWNFFQHESFITARVPRSDCPQCGPRLVAAPWARPGRCLTLLFEGFVMIMARQMPINGLAQLVGERDTRLCQPPNLANSKLTALAWYHFLRSCKTGRKEIPAAGSGVFIQGLS
jgi:hypothetical protein